MTANKNEVQTCVKSLPSKPSEGPRRYTIDLTPAAAEEVERIQKMFSLNIKDVFRFGLLLIRLYADAVRDKEEIQIVNPEKPNVVKVIKLPLFANDVA